MDITQITPDQLVLFSVGPIAVNATVLFTWLTIALLVAGSWAITRGLAIGPKISRWQSFLEAVVEGMRGQVEEIGGRDSDRFLPLVGTLFLFIAVSNLLSVVPGYLAPTGSLSTTAALAICVLVAVPVYGVASRGAKGYLRQYVEPSVFMAPFNVIGELSRTLALAVRLFGNVMSSAKIAAVLLAIAPLFIPVVMQVLGLVTGLIQAYIFAILAMVYIASGVRAQTKQERRNG